MLARYMLSGCAGAVNENVCGAVAFRARRPEPVHGIRSSDSVERHGPVSLRKRRRAWVSAGLAMDTTANPVYDRGDLRGCSALPPATLEIRLGLNG